MRSLVIATIVILYWELFASMVPNFPYSPSLLIKHFVIAVGDTGDDVIVSNVIDGDTVVLATGEHLRYIGMNTPELGSDSTKDECYSDNAKERNVQLVEGKHVRLKKDISDTDQYGRLLRYVYVDGLFVNKELVLEGYAKATAYRPDTAKQSELMDAQNVAYDAHIGIWKYCQNGQSDQSP